MKPRPLCPPARGHVPFRTPQTRSLSSADKLLRFITQLTILAIWKSVTTLSVPFGRAFAVWFWAGRSAYSLTSWLHRLVYKLLGWLYSPVFARNHWLRQWGKQHVPLDVRKWHVVVAVSLTLSIASWLLRKWRERFDKRLTTIRHLKERLKTAGTYAEWRELAGQLESVSPGDETARAKLYDARLLAQKLQHLRSVRQNGNVREMMFGLRSDLIRNVANVAKSQQQQTDFYDVPATVKEYIQEVKEQLCMFMDWPEAGVSAEEKLSFFRETRHAYGRTALLFSGGGGLGCFHIGVAKALFEHRMLPRVLAGSSVGSIIAGILATRTDSELCELFERLDVSDIAFFNNARAVELVHSWIQRGTLQDSDFLIRKLRVLMGDMTFLEAYERTGRILCVTVCPADTNEPARMLNYLTAPQALIWSAVAASSAFPGLFPAQHLLARNSRGDVVRFSAPSTHETLERRWRDGSLELDLPTFLLAEMFNCNHFLVSQTNPHIVPLLNIKKAMSNKWAQVAELEVKTRASQLQWFVPEWAAKWLRLLTQPWEGDITMVLPTALWQLGKTVVNPTTEDLAKATKSGEQAIWEKLGAIEANCAVEATLDACLARITNSVRERPLGTLGSRIPSWLHMSHIGSPAIASWGQTTSGTTHPGPVPAAETPLHGGSDEDGTGGAGGMRGGLGGSGMLSNVHMTRAQLLSGRMGPGAEALVRDSSGHEHLPDASPPRVRSWGSFDIADSVADFPAATMQRGRSSLGASCRYEYGGSSMAGQGSGEAAAGDDDVASLGSSGSGSSGVSTDPYVLAQLDCCDSSAVTDIWASLLPLASAAMAAKSEGSQSYGQGLDVIAP